jgi:hypothetical protein
MTNKAAQDPIRTYLSALRATGEIEAPFGAVAFIHLTTLLRPHEVISATTWFTGSRVRVVEGSPDAALSQGREVPLARLTTRLLSKAGPGRLSACLGLEPSSLPRLAYSLNLALLDHDDLAAISTPERLWVASVHALMEAASGVPQRTAVLTYAGLRAAGVRARRRAALVGEEELGGVASIVDQLVGAAGFGTGIDADIEAVA